MNYPYLITLPNNKNITILNEQDFLDLIRDNLGDSAFLYLEQYMLESTEWYTKLIKINQIFEDNLFDE